MNLWLLVIVVCQMPVISREPRVLREWKDVPFNSVGAMVQTHDGKPIAVTVVGQELEFWDLENDKPMRERIDLEPYNLPQSSPIQVSASPFDNSFCVYAMDGVGLVFDGSIFDPRNAQRPAVLHTRNKLCFVRFLDESSLLAAERDSSSNNKTILRVYSIRGRSYYLTRERVVPYRLAQLCVDSPSQTAWWISAPLLHAKSLPQIYQANLQNLKPIHVGESAHQNNGLQSHLFYSPARVNEYAACTPQGLIFHIANGMRQAPVPANFNWLTTHQSAWSASGQWVAIGSFYNSVDTRSNPTASPQTSSALYGIFSCEDLSSSIYVANIVENEEWTEHCCAVSDDGKHLIAWRAKLSATQQHPVKILHYQLGEELER